MASAGLRKELECSVCLSVYTDPVMLTCGHNYCRECIDRVLDTQAGAAGAGGFSCPECREEFPDRPALHRNITLRNIAENFLTQPGREDSGVFCSHCVDSPVIAVTSCLHCEVSLCEKHLRVHKRSPEHVLCDPTTVLKNRKCPVHNKILEYYCSQDSACICVSCCLIGAHKGHDMVSLDEASMKRKNNLRDALQKLRTERTEIEERVRNLQERAERVKEKADGQRDRVSALFRDLRRQLEDVEKNVLSEVSSQEKLLSFLIADGIYQLEIRKDELSRRISCVKELCDMADPLTVLQGTDWSNGGQDGDLDGGKDVGGDINVAEISHALQTGINDILTGMKDGVCVDKASDLTLDLDTAGNKLHISEDRKFLYKRSDRTKSRPLTSHRFHSCPQVISSQSFSAGRCYWEVDVGCSDSWRVGVCYPSMERTGEKSQIGHNDRSWGLYRVNSQYTVIHDNGKVHLLDGVTSDRVRVYVDYEAGRISFYDLCHPIRHLHTFTTTFTEPLHAVLGVWKGCINIRGGGREM